jgi:hypothetical protein
VCIITAALNRFSVKKFFPTPRIDFTILFHRVEALPDHGSRLIDGERKASEDGNY